MHTLSMREELEDCFGQHARLEFNSINGIFPGSDIRRSSSLYSSGESTDAEVTRYRHPERRAVEKSTKYEHNNVELDGQSCAVGNSVVHLVPRP